MNSSYKELLTQREALDQAIAAARKREIADAVRQARDLVAEFELSIHDLFPSGRGAKTTAKSGMRSKVVPKYRNPSTGQTWAGRGRAPRWIDGEDRTKYLIASAPPPGK